MDALFAPLFGAGPVTDATDGRALVRAMCAAEAALARACARAGLIESSAATAIGAAATELAGADAAELGDESVAGGNPVIPLVARLRAAVAERAGDEAAAAVHFGATSQDILDTALMLVLRPGLGLAIVDLAACAETTAEMAAAHRTTPMMARTLLQPAEPTTFGALAATWGSGLDRAALWLAGVHRALPVQLAGPAGTLAAWHPHGFEIVAAFADELDLAVPDGPWHAERTRVAELAGALGAASAAIGKVATDVVLLAQAELGELREDAPGGSSSMAHKQNAIAAVTARAAAGQVPGLVATLLTAAGGSELQRAAGGWHAEWPALLAAVRAVGGAAARLHTSLTGLHIDAAAMAANLAARSAPGSTDTGHAGDLVDRYLERRSR